MTSKTTIPYCANGNLIRDDSTINDTLSDKPVSSRVKQVSALVNNLPNEIIDQIFDLLGPFSRRLLGATCILLYRLYKPHLFTPMFCISLDESIVRRDHGPEYLHMINIWRKVRTSGCFIEPSRYMLRAEEQHMKLWDSAWEATMKSQGANFAALEPISTVVEMELKIPGEVEEEVIEVPRQRGVLAFNSYSRLQLTQVVSQASLLVNDLPLIAHVKIFKYLGTAQQRILGATCISFRETYKENFDPNEIILDGRDILDIPYDSQSPILSTGTSAYFTIVGNWISLDPGRCNYIKLHGSWCGLRILSICYSAFKGVHSYAQYQDLFLSLGGSADKPEVFRRLRRTQDRFLC